MPTPYAPPPQRQASSPYPTAERSMSYEPAPAPRRSGFAWLAAGAFLVATVVTVAFAALGGAPVPKDLRTSGVGASASRTPTERSATAAAKPAGSAAAAPYAEGSKAPRTSAGAGTSRTTGQPERTAPTSASASASARTTKAATRNTSTATPAKRTSTSRTTAAAAPSLATQVVRLTNKERAAQGCKPLTVNRTLSAVAQAHSKDMRDKGYFEHTSPDGRSPFDRMKDGGYTFRAAAENIAAGQPTAASVMKSWMNSGGHRANILNCSLTEIGVGVATGGQFGIYWTQDFGTPA